MRDLELRINERQVILRFIQRLPARPVTRPGLTDMVRFEQTSKDTRIGHQAGIGTDQSFE